MCDTYNKIEILNVGRWNTESIFANYIRQFRLQQLKDILYWNSDRVLIYAFVEQW